MSEETLHRMIESYMRTKQQCYTFGWQGGEPTLMGLDFFKKVTSLQSSLGSPGTVVANGFQTNGVLLDDHWAKHFADYKFLVGVSVDGPQKLHDRFRVDLGGRGTHAKVMKGIAALRRNNVEYNVLTLVSKSNVKNPEDVYNFLCANGINFHQYIECVEFDSKGQLCPFAITANEWGEFLCRIFDIWYKHDVYNVSVRLFDTILAQLVHGVSNTCASGTSCDQYFVVEYNGDVYPCDFNVTESLLLGNINSSAWEELQTSETYVKFAADKTRWNAACGVCPWLRFCNGDCPKNRIGRNPGSLSHLCQGWKMFYSHTISKFEALAEQIRLRDGL